MNVPAMAVLCDYPEELWPSMDLCAEMLLARLGSEHIDRIRASRFCPPFRHRLSRLLPGKGRRWGFNADRMLNRFWDYPRQLRRSASDFDVFHLCDHSYAQLLDVLPANRTGVLCHDIDTFRCLLEPRVEPRPRWFRRMARRVLTGLQKAAVVFHVSDLTRQQIENYGLVDPARLVQAPNGVAPDFTTDEEEGLDHSFLSNLYGRPFLLHVGSCIPRKRIDVLLDVFAGLKARHPDLLLVQVGGAWTPAQQEQIDRLGVGRALFQTRGLPRQVVAALYRRATLVLQPTEAEGFGLPIVEGLACGSIVVASDIPVLREVGGAAVVYCPVADAPTWVETASRLIQHSDEAPARSVRLSQARRYSWSEQAETIVTTYERLLKAA